MPPYSGPFHIKYKVMCRILASVTEVELCGTFTSLQTSAVVKKMAAEMGHQKPTTHVSMDIFPAMEIINDNNNKYAPEQLSCILLDT